MYTEKRLKKRDSLEWRYISCVVLWLADSLLAHGWQNEAQIQIIPFF